MEDWPTSKGGVVSDDLAKSLALLPPPLLDVFNSLPERPPNAASDAEFAFSLHSLLSALDPVVAARWHWKDTRKVLANLKTISHFGRRASEIISEQSKVTVIPRLHPLNI
jgi:tRNA dimethylallyltransferase